MEAAGIACKPDPLYFTENVADNWEKFVMEFNIFIETLPEATTERQKAMMLLNLAGQEAMIKENSFVYALAQEAVPAIEGQPAIEAAPAKSSFSVQTLKGKFQELCAPQRNTIMETARIQLQKSVAWIVTGILNNKVRKQLLKEPALTLLKAVSVCQVAELTDQSMDKLSSGKSADAPKDSSSQTQSAKLRNELKAKDATIQKLDNKVSDLEIQVEGLEQYSRRNRIQLTGLPEDSEEDIIECTLGVFNTNMKMDPPVLINEIDRIHCVGKVTAAVPRSRGVLIKFSTYHSRSRIMKARSALKFGSRPISSAFFLNEDLTRQRNGILYQLRLKKKNNCIIDVWTYNGSIIIKDNNRKISSARTLAEAEKLLRSLS
ncbi:hypothetical protein CAPTEDRAFT_210285 [Capitella teleta]|uniref:RRM domain-containing protein n=1 Tax=Capitella teleta TaxID=283909 RepID=N1PB34_CAPTE|nr:hypothetical protein CAPTEDRAFT_210285 [Capitella teleta]|eukprot:ELU18817.1 hypothetical protein CAPTEDRAFT_210285 [Capitella teleta]